MKSEKTLGQVIRQLRDQQDLSLRELAQKLEITPAFLCDIELGRRFPSEAVMTQIARLLKTTVDELKQYDFRAPVDELKEKIESDPQFAVMLRRAIEHKDFDSKSLEAIVKKLDDKNEK
jgi:transcriptional regulator with XRE-family HTH domain